MRARVLAVLVATMVTFTGSVAGSSVTTKKVKACDALASADIEATLGVTGVAPSTQGSPSTATRCSYQWTVTSGSSTAFGMLSVGIGTYDASVKRDLPKNAKAKGASKIPGVTVGYVNPDSGSSGAIIEAVKGKKFVTIQVFADGVTKDQLVKLMKVLLHRV